MECKQRISHLKHVEIFCMNYQKEAYLLQSQLRLFYQKRLGNSL